MSSGEIAFAFAKKKKKKYNRFIMPRENAILRAEVVIFPQQDDLRGRVIHTEVETEYCRLYQLSRLPEGTPPTKLSFENTVRGLGLIATSICKTRCKEYPCKAIASDN